MTSTFAAYITARTAATALNPGDYVVIVQGGATKHADPTLFNIGGADNATIMALPGIVSIGSDISTLQSQVAAVTTQSSLVGRRGTNTAITNATTVNTDLWSAVPTVPWVGDDGIQAFATFLVANTNTVGSGTNLVLNVLTKIAGVNMLNPAGVNLAPTGASTSYVVDVFLSCTAGSDGLHHSERMVLQIRPATTNNGTTSMAYGYATDAVTPAQVLDLGQLRQSTVTDFGTTQPSMEIRLNATVANANFSIQRMYSELQFLKDH